jgi:uncharacterized membrane protein YkvA (DUF1232 family)
MSKILYGEILQPGDEQEQSAQAKKIENGFWRTVTKSLARIPFMEDVVASYYCMMDPQTPTKVRGILLAALAYFVLPLDIVPDFIAGFGFTDDIAVLTAAIAAVKSSLTERHYLAAKNSLSDLASADDKNSATPQ